MSSTAAPPPAPPASPSGSQGPRAGKSFLRLAGPLVVSFVLRDLLTLIDYPFASRLGEDGSGVGEASLAALGLTQPIVFVMIACWVGASNGLTARLSAAMGAGEGERIAQLKRAAMHIQLVLIVVFLALAAGIWFFADRIGLDPLVEKQFRIYATVFVASRAVTSFWSILPDSLVKAHHDMKSTMWAGLISGVSNAVLNIVFVQGFHWGIFGIALATGLGGLAGLIYALVRAAHHEKCREAGGGDRTPGVYLSPVRAILAISIPAAITFGLMALESGFVNSLLNRAEDSRAALATWSVFDRASRLFLMPMIAGGVAMLPLVARRRGDGDAAGIHKALRTAFVWVLGYLLLFLVPATFFGAPWIVGDLIPLKEASAREQAIAAIRLMPLVAVGSGPMFLMRSTFEGLQRPLPGLIASLVRTLALVIPFVWFFVTRAQARGEETVRAAVFGVAIGVALASAGFAVTLWRHLKNEASSPS